MSKTHTSLNDDAKLFKTAHHYARTFWQSGSAQYKWDSYRIHMKHRPGTYPQRDNHHGLCYGGPKHGEAVANPYSLFNVAMTPPNFRVTDFPEDEMPHPRLQYGTYYWNHFLGGWLWQSNG